jgi:hypothetical protein
MTAMRSRGEAWAMTLVVTGIAVVWSGIVWAALIQLIVNR